MSHFAAIQVATETALEWLLANPSVIGATSTVLLAFFAGVQIWIEHRRSKERSTLAARHAHGPAWLARRTCEEAYRAAKQLESTYHWVQKVSAGPVLDRLERQMLEVLRLTSEAGGETADAGHAAFSAFLAYADRINALAAYDYERSRTPPWPSVPDRDATREIAAEALRFLRCTIEQLEVIAERRAHEPRLPRLSDLRILRQGRDEDGLTTTNTGHGG